MAKKDINMLEGPLLGNVIAYAIPIMLTGILQLLFNAADLVIVGRFCGSNSVAAVGATSSLINLIVNFFMGISVGCGITVAQAIGARNDKNVENLVHTAVPTAVISGLLLTVVGMGFAGNLLALMGTPETILPLSEIYVKIY